MVSDAVATVVLDAPLTTRLYLAGNTTTHTFMSGTLRSSPTEHVIVDYDTVVHLTVTLDSDPRHRPHRRQLHQDDSADSFINGHLNIWVMATTFRLNDHGSILLVQVTFTTGAWSSSIGTFSVVANL